MSWLMPQIMKLIIIGNKPEVVHQALPIMLMAATVIQRICILIERNGFALRVRFDLT